MHEPLITYINNHSTIPLTDTEIEAIKEVFVPRKLKKHQYFLQEGGICKYAAFLVKGAMRTFTIDDKGVEHMVRLSIENWWVGDRESYTKLIPSKYNIDAWENCEILVTTRADFQEKLSTIPAVYQMVDNINDNFTIATQRRLSVIGLSAEERYAELVNSYPEFLQRFPLHVIASYLGITRETLSRIRGNAIKK